MNILEINDENFEDKVLKTKDIVVCDFWAEWCGPCKQITPILEELANEFNDKVKIAKINIDSNPDIPTKYNIMSIPTLLLFKNGELISNQVGLQEKSTLSNWIKENL
ncbi:MAG: thioredoxin [Rickettsiales bacterium TMED251]|nr:MAG: thioredoxin [Rickettsiales bacterium TMED251]|tara:strand:+ start:1709 stop:2029 length:321 start_codon:yes stop_codon:yes gene_type:complete